MKDQIQEHFRGNLERVQALLDLHGASRGGNGPPPSHQADVLRAAVVFLHAALEDVVRSALEWRLPSAAAEHLEAIPLIGCERRTKFTLAELAQHRGKTVSALVEESVGASLAESNFNHPGDLAQALQRIGIDSGVSLEPFKLQLGAMMKRRHWIVHRADRNDSRGAKGPTTRSLSVEAVELWRDAVDGFGTALLAALG